MRSSVVLGFLAVAILATAPVMAGLPPEIRTYNVEWTDTPPAIDGVISEGEWDTTQDTGDWRLLRDASASVDFENNRFQMLWDNDFLYVQTTSDYGFWDLPSGGDGMDFNRDNANLYLDPNLDDSPNDTTNNDGYQIVWNQYEGAYDCSACTGAATNQGQVDSGWGFFTEAHIGGLFGNQARWVGLQETVGSTNNYTVDFPNPSGGFDGGVTELAIPWTDLNAPGTEDNPDTPEVDETNTSLDITLGGTDPGKPQNGDEWLMNITRISSDVGNLLPAYNWTPGNFFAEHPHAEITFTRIGHPHGEDFNKDGKVDGADFLLWQANFGLTEGATQIQGDANDDGAVDGQDFLIWQASFGFGIGAGSTTVPEPSTHLMMITFLLACGRRRNSPARIQPRR